MAITVKHSKVSTIPDDANTDLVRPSDWNADHTLVGTIDVANGGTGATTLTGYVKGNGTSAITAVATVPSTDITGLGTMSTQNANAVAITGGTINGTTIGATVPSTVNATTITGQTGQLNGTGQNLVIQSQTINTSPSSWTTTGSATLTGNSTTAPDSTNTASTLTASGTQSSARRGTAQVPASGVVYTGSIYFKAGTSNFGWIGLVFVGTGSRAWFNLNTGTVGTLTAGVTATITSVGDGWYRCSATATSTAAFGFIDFGISNADNTTNVTAGQTIFLWGAQLEVGSTANTYIPTTTTAVYGTPTLSFSGVSSIGLLSNGALYLEPAGTGAIQADATTSTTAGGNARGANAVDWQTLRNSASEVASGSYSIVGGGQRNTASGSYSQSLGGFSNASSGFESVLVGGQGNAASGQIVFIGGGTSNTASGYGSNVVGGTSNTGAGVYSFIGGGQLNSGTSGSIVTTQSATMNATTAVTLSGSNASIKVGQYISGTSIGTDTYVAAISGTSLTLSKNASGSSTSTLSFFTPHGVVVGGGNNQATGSYSFIGGGGDAGTAANRNVASGDWSVVAGGWRNVASGEASFIGGGGSFGGGVAGNTASGVASVVCGGYANVSNATSSAVGGGNNNIASGIRSTVVGGTFGNTRAITGNTILGTSDRSIASTTGVSQAGLLVLAKETTDATPTALTSNTAAAGTTNQVILPNNSAYFFRGEVISGVTGGGDTKGWTIEGVIKRGANAAPTTLVGVTVLSSYADLGAATWTIAVTADTTNGGLQVTFTGQASTIIRTVCQIRTTEMTY
jgi:hypothetical protein